MNEHVQSAETIETSTALNVPCVAWQLEEQDTVEVLRRDRRTGKQRVYEVRLTPGGTGD